MAVVLKKLQLAFVGKELALPGFETRFSTRLPRLKASDQLVHLMRKVGFLRLLGLAQQLSRVGPLGFHMSSPGLCCFPRVKMRKPPCLEETLQVPAPVLAERSAELPQRHEVDGGWALRGSLPRECA